MTAVDRIYRMCFQIAESQVFVGITLLIAAGAISACRGQAAFARHEDGRRPLSWWLRASGWWLVGAGFVIMVILFLSFYPARRT